ncbi:GbsR/MarR family transcriptional regulator [Phytomonospora endophytica]|uniref:Putative transcriptional regulator n=1 Tax=Phytomonospora endophytica TaxID=714109 RepID=A0A841FHU7_9ACTN|nr:MarR family transcriptional regulator [Phytomonospora endophytica]MBB6032677.1 putative transcriptional regulator [Phytomonospora endophytica]GIG66173.1 transcriptional regulator [Phytomonospora endophytica]
MPETTPTPGERANRAAEFRESLASQFVVAGMARMPARVMCALLTTDADGMTAAELAEALQASPAAISGAVRYLTQTDMIRRDREPGSRRDVFRLFEDPFASMLRRRDDILKLWGDKMREGSDVLGDGTPAGRRLAGAAETFSLMHMLLPRMLDEVDRMRRKG